MTADYIDSVLDDKSIIAACPECGSYLLLTGSWPQLFDEGHSVPACPGCEPDRWGDHADPVLSTVEAVNLSPIGVNITEDL